MGVGIIVPGYYKLRELELNEAKEYALDRSIRMKEQIQRSIDVLDKAGVAEIESYIIESKEKLISDYKEAQPDPRIHMAILNDEGNLLFDSDNYSPLPITPQLVTQIKVQKSNSMQYSVGADHWLLTFEKHEAWNWHLISRMSAQQIYVDSQDYLIYVVTISFLVLLFVLSLFILLTRQLRRKTKIIMNHLEMFKAGRYDKRFKVSGNDEFSVLQNSINSMIDSIEIEIESRKTAEKELISLSKAHPKEANQDDSSLLASLSFDAKDPINVIQGFSDLLAGSKLNKKQVGYARSILQASQILNRQLNNTAGNNRAPNTSATAGAKSKTDIQLLCRSLKNVEVVLVDDDPLNREYISEVLQQCKMRSTMISDDKQLITHLEDNDIDLILLDMEITEFSAEETIKQIRGKRQSYLNNIPIIAITGHSADKDLKKFLDIGATAAITKPFTPSHMLAEISRIVDAQ